MKINKKLLKNIIAESLQEAGFSMDQLTNIAGGADPAELAGAQEKTKDQTEANIEDRIQQAFDRMKAAESILKTIDDPNEVALMIVALIRHLRTIQDDLTDPELQRLIVMLRTVVLPDMSKKLGAKK